MMQLVWRYLKQQKRRTAFTIIGVVLASALVASVGLFFTSFQAMMLKQAAIDDGTHDFASMSYGRGGKGLTLEQTQKISGHYLVERCGVAVDGEMLTFPDTAGDMQTFDFGQRDQTALSMKEYELSAGRLPENETEIMVNEWLLPYVRLNGKLTANILKSKNIPMESNESEFENVVIGSAEFTVVGIFKNRTGNTIVTGGILPSLEHEGYMVFVKTKAGLNKTEAMQQIQLDTIGARDEREREGVSFAPNNGYLQWSGQRGTSSMQNAFLTTFLVLAGIILFAMGIVIRNSFAMSVSEKMSQYGTLRCVGASPSQIRHMVFGEALFIWLISIPLGLGLGLAAMSITFGAVQKIDLSALQYFRLVPTAWPFLLTAALSFLAVMLAARSPARRASKISAIEAVRGSTIFREGNHFSRRSGRILGKISGLPGQLASRNIRRNKKRYRTTVLSVALSVALFICIGGFFQSLVSGMTQYGRVKQMDFILEGSGEETIPALSQLQKELSQNSEIAHTALFKSSNAVWELPKDRIGTEYASLYSNRFDEKGVYSIVYFINRATYETMELAPESPSYDELLSSKSVVLYQKALASSMDSGMKTYDISNYKPGEETAFSFFYQDGEPTANSGGSDSTESSVLTRTITVKIGALSQSESWFQPPSSRPYLFIPMELEDTLLKQDGRYPDGQFSLNLAVKATPQGADSISKILTEKTKSMKNTYLNNFYADEKENRNTVLVLNIFVYGFLTVIILISCINLFNTVSANLQSRKRELAMMRAVGMANRQLWKMLLLECVLYGVLGTLWGTACGLGLQALLLFTMRAGMQLSMFSPLYHILLSLAAAVAVSLLAGFFPIRQLIRRPIVEEIRSKE